MVNTTTLYYNTGFNKNNIPDSPTLLNTCFHRYIEGHWDYQDLFLSSLKIKIGWDTVKNVDYLKYGNAYYFVIGISMINENNAELSLELDALTSIGGANSQTYTSGIITRAHSLNDELFGNICDEPIGCVEELQLEDLGVIGDFNNSNSYNVLVSPVALNIPNPLESATSIDFKSVAGDVTVSVPRAPIQSATTDIKIELPTGNSDAYSGPLGYYMYGVSTSDDALINTNLDYLRSLGLESAVLYSYSIPADYVSIDDSIGPWIGSMSGKMLTGTQIGADVGSGYSNIKNKKTYAMYNYFILRSNTSGDLKTYEAHELFDNTHFTDINSPIYFNIISDPQYGGRPYCVPKYFKGEMLKNPTYESVSGLPWYDLPIVYTNKSGMTQIENSYKLSVAGYGAKADSYLLNMASSIIPGPGSSKSQQGTQIARDSSGNPMGAAQGATNSGNLANYGIGQIGNLMSKASDMRTMVYNANSTDIQFEQSKVVAPELSSTPAMGLQRFLKNNFEIYKVKPRDRDIENIDKFFTMYGYAQPNISFNKSYLTGRQHFNYIKCSDIHINRGDASDKYGIGVKSMAENQLINGVRIWHTLPSVVESNPIV